MRRNNASPVNVSDKHDVRFRGLRRTVELVYQTLHHKGVGVEVRHAAIIIGHYSNFTMPPTWTKVFM